MKKEDIVVIITFLIAMFLFLWYLFGKSPTLEQVILGVAMLNSGWIYSVNSKLERHLGEHVGYNRAKQEKF